MKRENFGDNTGQLLQFKKTIQAFEKENHENRQNLYVSLEQQMGIRFTTTPTKDACPFVGIICNGCHNHIS